MGDGKFRKALCKRQLLYTESLITETPIAFPARASIAAGLSYWAMEAKKLGRDLQMAKDKPEFSNADECNVQFSRETSRGHSNHSDEYVLPHHVFLCLRGYSCNSSSGPPF